MVLSTTTPITGDIGAAFPDGATISNAILSTALANGSTIKSGQTSGNNVLIQAYDNDNSTYRTFATLTSGNTPSFALAAPAGGTLTVDPSTLSIGGTQINATAAEINRACDVSARMVTLAGSTSITEATHDSKVLLLTGTGSAFTQTLPAATGSGARFRFVVGAVNTSNHLIKVTGDDVMYGNIITNSTGDTPDLAQPWPTAVDSDTITLNGTTTGGAAVGDFVELIDIAADKWFVYGVTTSSGTEATPFSATVS